MLWKYLKFIGCCLLITFVFGVVFGYFGLNGGVVYGIVMSLLMIVDLVLIIALIPIVILFEILDKFGKK